MTKKEYNGWFNYETWLVKLWMDNEQGTQSFYSEEAQRFYDQTDEDDTHGERVEEASHSFADFIKEQHEESIESQGVPENGFIADLVNAAMSEVNWYEIACSLLEDIEAPEPETVESENA